LTRSLKTKAAQTFARDYPELSLVQWRQDDTASIRKCFEGCYGVFIILGFISEAKISMREWTRAEIDLGKRCLEAADAAKVSHLIYPTFPSIFNASNGDINIRYFETAYQICIFDTIILNPINHSLPRPFLYRFRRRTICSMGR